MIIDLKKQLEERIEILKQKLELLAVKKKKIIIIIIKF